MLYWGTGGEARDRLRIPLPDFKAEGSGAVGDRAGSTGRTADNAREPLGHQEKRRAIFEIADPQDLHRAVVGTSPGREQRTSQLPER